MRRSRQTRDRSRGREEGANIEETFSRKEQNRTKQNKNPVRGVQVSRKEGALSGYANHETRPGNLRQSSHPSQAREIPRPVLCTEFRPGCPSHGREHTHNPRSYATFSSRTCSASSSCASTQARRRAFYCCRWPSRRSNSKTYTQACRGKINLAIPVLLNFTRHEEGGPSHRDTHVQIVTKVLR